MSAMICVQYGPITMELRSTTRTPARGPFDVMRVSGPNVLRSGSRLIGLGQPQHAFGDEALDELGADRRDARDQDLAQVALDVILLRIAVAAVRHHRLLARVVARFAREIFRRVGA